MGDTGADPASRRGRMMRGAAIALVAVLLAGAAVFGIQLLRSRYDVPRADLLGGMSPPTSTPSPTPSPTTPPGADITGPLNILLVGIDPRESVPTWQPNADAVLILHVTKGLDRGYLFSLPRDLVVDIPSFPKAGYGGGRTKLTHAMSYGSRRTGGARPDVAQGFQLLAKTVSKYTGIARFDAGAVLNFRGYRDLINAIGGVDLYVDQRVASIHLRPDGRMRTPGGTNGYSGPQMVYEKGQRHFNGWQALDYARQRYISGGDYTRQRHQQQLLKAMLRKVLDRKLASDPAGIDRVLRAVSKTLVFDGQGRRPIDFAFALSNLRPEALTLVGLPGLGVESGGGYAGEQLEQVGRKFIAELRAGRAEAFLKANPKLVVKG
ncbi:LCP family protein [Micromonospora sp. NPDC049679]|uniref:LCP family protein n=1 Tax=Micromonospora sp. NPDC049679 TaxID=3155920 RepID=UPI003404F215